MTRILQQLFPWRERDEDGTQYRRSLAETYRRSQREEIRRQFDDEIEEAEAIIRRMANRGARGE